MVSRNPKTIQYRRRCLGYADACRVARRASAQRSDMVHLCLRGTTHTTTAALARLILLRRDLLASGRDLRIIGLTGRAKALYEVNRLGSLLPLLPHADA
jgi:hypothetical protein